MTCREATGRQVEFHRLYLATHACLPPTVIRPATVARTGPVLDARGRGVESIPDAGCRGEGHG